MKAKMSRGTSTLGYQRSTLQQVSRSVLLQKPWLYRCHFNDGRGPLLQLNWAAWPFLE